MKAAIFSTDGLAYGHCASPVAAGEALPAMVRAAALTNLDIITAEGRHYLSPPRRPFVPGNECVAIMPGGERLFFPVTSVIAPHGSMAQQALVLPGRGLPVPDGISDALAAALGNAGLAGWLPLSWRAAMQPGERVLILGATGATGLIAVAAAHLLGAGQVIAAGRNPDALARAQELGATATISLSEEEDFAAALASVSDGGIDIVLDYLNGPATVPALAALNVGGRLVQIGSALGPDLAVPAQIARKNSLSLLGFAYYHAPVALQRAAYARLCEAAQAGRVGIQFAEIALADIADAWDRQKAGSRLRQVIIPD